MWLTKIISHIPVSHTEQLVTVHMDFFRRIAWDVVENTFPFPEIIGIEEYELKKETRIKPFPHIRILT